MCICVNSHIDIDIRPTKDLSTARVFHDLPDTTIKISRRLYGSNNAVSKIKSRVIPQDKNDWKVLATNVSASEKELSLGQ